jgi:amyloid beta precursor protein binding protein 1
MERKKLARISLLTKFQNEKASSFWIITQAIGNFYDIHKELPLPGSVPDMKAQSSVYVQLQNLYKKKAREDVVEVTKIVESLDAKHIVTKEEIEIYCKNAAFVKLIPGRNDPETTGKEFATFVGKITEP